MVECVWKRNSEGKEEGFVHRTEIVKVRRKSVCLEQE